jgi:hypothetical protein
MRDIGVAAIDVRNVVSGIFSWDASVLTYVRTH